MADGHGQAPVIVKKVKKGGHGHHGGAWKVAYADMVTALMALFIVLWILGQSDDVIQNVAGYFQDPVGFRDGGVPSLMESGSDPSSPEILDDNSTSETGGPLDLEEPSERWRDRARQIRTALEDVSEFERYHDQIELALTPDGLKITMVESPEAPLFELGGTELEAEARRLLAAIGGVVADLPNHLTIEGHTDALPFGRAGERSNWRLSTGRADSARRILEAAGVRPSHIYEVSGLADRQLYNPLDPADSRNRRVAITVLSREALGRRQQQVHETLLSDEVLDYGDLGE